PHRAPGAVQNHVAFIKVFEEARGPATPPGTSDLLDKLARQAMKFGRHFGVRVPGGSPRRRVPLQRVAGRAEFQPRVSSTFEIPGRHQRLSFEAYHLDAILIHADGSN